ncbi:hypothetical protein GCM10010195_34240 [Kitasatospora griseola]|nr:hypothetical protein GCM10010195_34240 [Kitasatospora griseola]
MPDQMAGPAGMLTRGVGAVWSSGAVTFDSFGPDHHWFPVILGHDAASDRQLVGRRPAVRAPSTARRAAVRVGVRALKP